MWRKVVIKIYLDGKEEKERKEEKGRKQEKTNALTFLQWVVLFFTNIPIANAPNDGFGQFPNKIPREIGYHGK